MNVETLPVLTVCQPYADLIAHGVKLPSLTTCKARNAVTITSSAFAEIDGLPVGSGQ